ncbi:MAG: CinA family protein [Actinomycetaceae bacterium]|nr:CinA family protein [Arcanobacterium sp.]MDD7687334.1 CinA family protein [Actinomycetaceae bacterium]MDY5274103.1 CinA family protein [Arcanobacterium sp.]
MIGVSERAVQLAETILVGAAARGAHIAVAESLTGGALAATLVSVPGASDVFRGGAVTYATDTKASILGVDTVHLARTGPVDPIVAQQMARGVAELFGADYALATTGVAGPGPADGHDAGTVFIGVMTPEGAAATECHFVGDRDAVRVQTVERALELLLMALH